MALLALLASLALALGGCGDTLQDQPVAISSLEAVIVKSRFPVYWLGVRFLGMRISSVGVDPSGAVTLQYGDCLIGGQYTCVTPLQIVTSPDNSFLPGGGAVSAHTTIRGVRATITQDGKALAIPTGAVVVSVYGRTPLLVRAAVQMMVPLNKVALPEAPLPKPLPDSGFDRLPLPSELPPGAIP